MIERIFNEESNIKLIDIVNSIICDYIDDYFKNNYNIDRADLAASYDMEVTVS